MKVAEIGTNLFAMSKESIDYSICYSLTPEILDLAEFARKMRVSPNTIRNWIQIGKLLEGIHFLRAGRKYHFPWGPELIEKLLKHWHPEPSPPRPSLRSRKGNRGYLRLRA
jgi:hypothetical protein